jgi:hypothetical protein
MRRHSHAKRKQQRGRGPSRFKASDAKRAVKAALAAGLSIGRLEIDPQTGRISVIPGQPETTTKNPWDQVRTKNAAHEKRTP